MSGRRVTVIGLGLIGASIAKRLHAAGCRVGGVDIDVDTRERAARDGIPAVAPGEDAEQPELIVVAVPPAETAASVLAALQRWPEALVTDVASVKVSVIPSPDARADLSRYLPGHPLAGSAHGGYEASSAELFDDAVWALCPTAVTPLGLAARFSPFLDALGAVALICTPQQHDRAVARSSHLPHVTAAALAGASVIDPAAMIATLSGGALRDSSRIAAADLELWWEIFSANRAELIDSIDDFEELLTGLKSAIAAGDLPAAAAIWKRGQDAQALITRCRWSAREYHEVARPLVDGWEPWLAMGDGGTVLRKLELAGYELRGQASRPLPR
jgi:prephenate dehydrogenase